MRSTNGASEAVVDGYLFLEVDGNEAAGYQNRCHSGDRLPKENGPEASSHRQLATVVSRVTPAVLQRVSGSVPLSSSVAGWPADWSMAGGEGVGAQVRREDPAIVERRTTASASETVLGADEVLARGDSR